MEKMIIQFIHVRLEVIRHGQSLQLPVGLDCIVLIPRQQVGPGQTEYIIGVFRVQLNGFTEILNRPRMIIKPGITETEIVIVRRIFFAADGKDQDSAQRLQHNIKSYIGVTTDVKVVPITTIERSIGKAKRVVDKRPR